MHVLLDISAPQTRINVLCAALKRCCKADHFEYNKHKYGRISLNTKMNLHMMMRPSVKIPLQYFIILQLSIFSDDDRDEGPEELTDEILNSDSSLTDRQPKKRIKTGPVASSSSSFGGDASASPPFVCKMEGCNSKDKSFRTKDSYNKHLK